jgi:hypothetical protein
VHFAIWSALMLQLDETALLLDGLRPPSGMEIDVAVGTTFTLDLTALLAIPVAAIFDATQQSEESADLLATLQRYADRTVLFCQAGAISVPAQYRAAHTFVEQTVVEVAKPAGGIFHPKAWVVRFTGGGRVLHRVLVMSRNLTFDRAWDVLVRLDEEPDLPSRGAMNRNGLIEFLEALPARAVPGRLARPQQRLLRELLTGVRGARFAVPDPFYAGRFAPLLADNRGQPFYGTCDNALAISPYLTSSAAKRFIRTATGRARVVSRTPALNAAASGLAEATELLRIKDTLLNAQESVDNALDLEDAGVVEHGEGDARAEQAVNPSTPPSPAMRGLHAKIYVQDRDTEATVWLGSANLTEGAFRTNVDLLVQLTGPKRHAGTDQVLSRKPLKGNLSWLVEEYHDLPETDTGGDDEITELESLSYELASREFTIDYAPLATAGSDQWRARLTVARWQPPEAVKVVVSLLSLRRAPVDLAPGFAEWTALGRNDITPFLVLTASSTGASRRMLVRAKITGDPPDRRSSILASAIKSKDDFMRYLAALLGHSTGSRGEQTGGFDGWVGGLRGDRVLEDLLDTASRRPKSLASLEETLRHLEHDPNFAEIVPPDFRQLWDAVYAARKKVIG